MKDGLNRAVSVVIFMFIIIAVPVVLIRMYIKLPILVTMLVIAVEILLARKILRKSGTKDYERLAGVCYPWTTKGVKQKIIAIAIIVVYIVISISQQGAIASNKAIVEYVQDNIFYAEDEVLGGYDLTGITLNTIARAYVIIDVSSKLGVLLSITVSIGNEDGVEKDKLVSEINYQIDRINGMNSVLSTSTQYSDVIKLYKDIILTYKKMLSHVQMVESDTVILENVEYEAIAKEMVELVSTDFESMKDSVLTIDNRTIYWLVFDIVSSAYMYLVLPGIIMNMLIYYVAKRKFNRSINKDRRVEDVV